MCGILGSVNIAYKPEALFSIRHRGPDADGVLHLSEKNHTITLAHRRLSIVDLSANGAQPMTTDDKSSFIVFNGEIYNHSQLRQNIHFKNFKGHSDSETLLYCLDEFSTDCLESLNGIFAFAFFNRKEQKLYLVRDRFGVKPLYYTFRNNSIFFCSELRAFRQHFKLRLDLQEVAESLQMRFVASPGTIYEGIKKVEPGQAVIFDLSKSQITIDKKLFALPTPAKKISIEKEYRLLVKEYGELFENAVERQLMADVNVGVFLSGGIDSALVAAIAKKKAGKNIAAFTVGFADNHADDETEAAKETADILGLDHQCTQVKFTDFLDHLIKIIKIVEEPIGTSSIIPMYSLAELAAQKVKVVLSGQGADEPLHGYDQYRWLFPLNWFREHKYAGNVVAAAKVAGLKKEYVRRFTDALNESNVLVAYRKYNSICSPEEITRLTNNGKRKSITDFVEINNRRFAKNNCALDRASSTIYQLFPYLDLRTSLPDDLLMYTDKITMNFGLECRVPFLDNDLIAFIETLDNRYKSSIRGGKLIHKKFAKEYLPDKIINRKKIVFQPPSSQWFKTSIKEIKQFLTSNKAFNEIFDAQEIKNIMQRHVNGENLDKKILLLLSYCCIMSEKKEAIER